MSESIIPEEQEDTQEEYGFSKLFFYIFAALALLIICFLSYGKYSANSEAYQAKQQVKQISNSTGAKIEKLIKLREDNKKKWSEEQKQIDNSMIKQAQLNSNTEKLEEELEKLNISLIK